MDREDKRFCIMPGSPFSICGGWFDSQCTYWVFEFGFRYGWYVWCARSKVTSRKLVTLAPAYILILKPADFIIDLIFLVRRSRRDCVSISTIERPNQTFQRVMLLGVDSADVIRLGHTALHRGISPLGRRTILFPLSFSRFHRYW